MISVGLRDTIAQIGTWFICFIAVDVVLLLMHRLGGKERIQWDAADVLLSIQPVLSKFENSPASHIMLIYVDMLGV